MRMKLTFVQSGVIMLVMAFMWLCGFYAGFVFEKDLYDAIQPKVEIMDPFTGTTKMVR